MSFLSNNIPCTFFSFFTSHLRGPIPTSIGQLTKLRYVSLAENQLTGVLPTTLDALTNLRAFSIADQVRKGGGISGPLTTFRFHPDLKTLQLANNQFSGTLPAQLLEGAEQLDGVLKVDVSNNRYVYLLLPPLVSSFILYYFQKIILLVTHHVLSIVVELAA